MPRGWALVMRGKAVEGVAQILQGWEMHQRVGTTRRQTYPPSLLAEAMARQGSPRSAWTSWPRLQGSC